MNRQTIGIITKADLVAEQQIARIGEWLRQSGAEHLFITSAQTGQGVAEVIAFLQPQEHACPVQ